MKLAIAQNPHIKNPKKLWTTLEREEKRYKKDETTDFDKSGFEKLKNELQKNPRMVVK